MIKKIVSGGQTGVDRAALDAAIQLNIPHGGWCPKGRLAELGETIPLIYSLTETHTSEYSERTKLNIRDSDGTIIFVLQLPIKNSDGTLLTIQEAKDKNKPYLVIDLSQKIDFLSISDFVNTNRIETLNIAGPRESQSPGIYKECLRLFNEIFPIILDKNSQKRFSKL